VESKANLVKDFIVGFVLVATAYYTYDAHDRIDRQEVSNLDVVNSQGSVNSQISVLKENSLKTAQTTDDLNKRITSLEATIAEQQNKIAELQTKPIKQGKKK
jgi:peptidoglycan hydrolase CwlO-like protein